MQRLFAVHQQYYKINLYVIVLIYLCNRLHVTFDTNSIDSINVETRNCRHWFKERDAKCWSKSADLVASQENVDR